MGKENGANNDKSFVEMPLRERVDADKVNQVNHGRDYIPPNKLRTIAINLSKT